jgi:hypothetical protein
LRAYVVSRETCAKVAAELQLGRRLRRYAPPEHDRDEVDNLAGSANVLADLTEAVIGAVYLTFGFECVRGAVIEAFEQHIRYAERSHVDSKTELQELLAKSGRMVAYRVVDLTGPAHERRFSVEALVEDEVLGRGEGPSKKRAEQMAAGEALAELVVRSRAERPRRVRLLARRPRGAEAAGGGPAEVPVEGAADAVREPATGQSRGDAAGAETTPQGRTGREQTARPAARRRRRRGSGAA